MDDAEHTDTPTERRLGARLLPLLLAATLASPLAGSAHTAPLLALLAGSIAVVVLGVSALVEPRTGRTLAPLVTVKLLLTATLAAWLTARALLSASPHTAFLGTLSQHSGAALWIVAAGWLTGTALVADKRALRDMLGVFAGFGVLFALLAVGAPSATADGVPASTAGPLEAPESLASFLAVAAFASLAWSRTSTGRVVRMGGAATAALCLLVAWRTAPGIALAGAAVGAAVIGALYLGRPGRTRTLMLAVVIPLAGTTVTASLALAATGLLGPLPFRAVTSISPMRATVWESAVAQLAASPLAGRGPDLFSAWTAWSLRDAVPAFTAAYDPHNALLGLALGGGLVVILLAVSAAMTALASTIGAFEDARRAPALAAIVAMPAVLAGAGLLTRVTPLSAAATAAIMGALLASVRSSGTRGADTPLARRVRTGAVVAMMAGCVATVVAAAIALPTQRALPSLADEDLLGTIALYERWPDAAYAARAVEVAATTGLDPTMLDRLLDSVDHLGEHRVDLALGHIRLGRTALESDPAAWSAFVDAIERGTVADPASGLWYAIAATQADESGRHADSVGFARRALEFRLNPADRVMLEELAGE